MQQTVGMQVPPPSTSLPSAQPIKNVWARITVCTWSCRSRKWHLPTPPCLTQAFHALGTSHFSFCVSLSGASSALGRQMQFVPYPLQGKALGSGCERKCSCCHQSFGLALQLARCLPVWPFIAALPKAPTSLGSCLELLTAAVKELNFLSWSPKSSWSGTGGMGSANSLGTPCIPLPPLPVSCALCDVLFLMKASSHSTELFSLALQGL